ncbi:putative amidoligase domain-containing protein [Paenibacillus sp. 481]|uniref:putative amidoligase domain-containing protein n=1 Tax=Paenibacillus sp. 481 TaxID=2835869 RepID=UPI001E416AD8|nr:hypothetical protein [Paenibacillus sp. 481]UHA73061.1 hypothetical protein KIK04_21065 [Paenibacillus sp. 481]
MLTGENTRVASSSDVHDKKEGNNRIVLCGDQHIPALWLKKDWHKICLSSQCGEKASFSNVKRKLRANGETGEIGEIGEAPFIVVWSENGAGFSLPLLERATSQRGRRMDQLAQWVARIERRGRIIVLNRYGRCWNDTQMRARLQCFGVPTAEHATWRGLPPSDAHHYVRTICFWVNQWRVVAAAHCSRTLSGHYLYRPLLNWQQPPFRRLSRMATRAAYALGWDTVAVTISCNPQDKEGNEQAWPTGVLDEPQAGDVVERVEPVPAQLPEWVAEAYAQQWEEELAQWQGDNDQAKVKFGLDMELILYDAARAKLVPASRHLPIGGVAGCDAVRFGGKVIHPLMELRPKPAHSPEQLLQHLHQAVRLAWRYICNKQAPISKNSERDTHPRPVTSGTALSWLVGSKPRGYFPLGGHIHFSGFSPSTEWIRVLDTYVTLPLSLMEDRRGHRRRPQYGAFGDVREQAHGGEGGFEYRSLPSFMVTPSFTLEVLTLVQAVVKHWRSLQRRDSVRDDMISLVLNKATLRTSKKKRLVTQDDSQLSDELRAIACELLTEIMTCVQAEKNIESSVVDASSISELERLQSLHTKIKIGWSWDEEADIRLEWLDST